MGRGYWQQVEDEYEIERDNPDGTATVYQCFIEYAWVEDIEGYDDEGCPINYSAYVEIDRVQIGAWWDIDQQGHDTGTSWECAVGQEMPDLLGGLTEVERTKFERDMTDKAASAAEAYHERMMER